MATVLVISLSDLGSDPRVERQIVALRKRHDVIAAGLGPPAVEDVRFVPLEPSELPRYPILLAQLGVIRLKRLAGLHRRAYWAQHHLSGWRDALAAVGADLVVVNDTHALPLAFAVAGRAPVIFDAHEYSPDEYESWRWRLFTRRHVEWICRTYLPRTAGMTVIGSGIGELYAREFGVRSVVVTNAPPYAALEPTSVEERIRMIHLGLADPQRRLEETVEMMRRLDERYLLDLLLVGSERFPAYVEKLHRLAAGDERIRFLPPVDMHDVISFANAYDIGVFLLPPKHVNQKLTLPNKFFAYIQARIVPAIGPSPEMADIVARWDCGIVAPDFTPRALARAIAQATPERLAAMKTRADAAARELCAECNEEVILDLADEALRRRPQAAPAR